MLTNYKTWIFVRYSLLTEVQTVAEIDNCDVAARFEVCQEIELLNDELDVISAAKLAQLVKIIIHCCKDQDYI